MDSVFIIHTTSSLFLLCHVFFFMEVTFCVCSYEMNFPKLFSAKKAKHRLDGVYYLKCFLIENILSFSCRYSTAMRQKLTLTVKPSWHNRKLVQSLPMLVVTLFFFCPCKYLQLNFFFYAFTTGMAAAPSVFTLVRWRHDCANYYKIYI